VTRRGTSKCNLAAAKLHKHEKTQLFFTKREILKLSKMKIDLRPLNRGLLLRLITKFQSRGDIGAANIKENISRKHKNLASRHTQAI